MINILNSVSDGDFKEGDGYIIPFADSPLKNWTGLVKLCILINSLTLPKIMFT